MDTETSLSGRLYYFRDIITPRIFDAWINSSMELVDFVDIAGELELIPDLAADQVFLIVRGSVIAANQRKRFCELVATTDTEEVWIAYDRSACGKGDDKPAGEPRPGRIRERLLSDDVEEIRNTVENWGEWNLKVLTSQYLISPERLKMVREKLRL